MFSGKIASLKIDVNPEVNHSFLSKYFNFYSNAMYFHELYVNESSISFNVFLSNGADMVYFSRGQGGLLWWLEMNQLLEMV